MSSFQKAASVQRELADERVQLKELFENAPEAILLVDKKYRAVRVNREFVRMFGYEQEELIGRSMLTMIVPAELRQEAEHFTDLVGSGQTVNAETVRVSKAGRRIDVSLLEVPLKLSDENISGYAIYRDISEQKLAEQLRADKALQTALRGEVGLALAGVDSLGHLLQECAEALVRHLDAAFARIWTTSKNGELLELQASAGLYTHLDGPHSRIAIGKLKIGLIAKERKPHLTNDVLNDPEVSDKDWARREGMVAFAGYPLLVGARVVGVMALFARRPLSQSVLDMLASVADAVTQGIERKQAEQFLRESEARLRLLLDLNNRVVSNLDLRNLFKTLSSELRRVFKCDFVGLALPESDGKQLREQLVDFPEGKGLFKEGALIPMEGSPSGLSFQRAKPLLIESVVKAGFGHGVYRGTGGETFQRMATAEGIKAGCLLPLVSDKGAFAVLQVFSRHELTFGESDLEFLGQVADQIAIAVKNALEYRQVSETKEQLAEQTLYLESEIRTEHNFEEIIGKSKALIAVLESIRIVASAHSTVLIEGETGTGKELVARAIHNLSIR